VNGSLSVAANVNEAGTRAAKATFRKDRRLNIRLSSKDLEAIQKRALAEGVPSQTLISSLLTSTRPDASKRSNGENGRRTSADFLRDARA
jgi:hypothetical protein